MCDLLSMNPYVKEPRSMVPLRVNRVFQETHNILPSSLSLKSKRKKPRNFL